METEGQTITGAISQLNAKSLDFLSIKSKHTNKSDTISQQLKLKERNHTVSNEFLNLAEHIKKQHFPFQFF